MSAARSSTTALYCVSFRKYFSFDNMKSVVHGFVYEYETPKIVTIHSVSIAVMCRLIQLLILIYGVAYLMIHKKGYQETDTSIISSITLKVKGIGYNQTGQNQTLVIDGADYIVPPQENNALFLMTNFIRTDQEHKRCAESPDEKLSSCRDDAHCVTNKNFQKANGKWTGRCLKKNNSSINSSQSITGLCELEGWCPVENDLNIPNPIRDALNFTIFVKNFIEFPLFKVIRKNIQANVTYLKRCNYDPVKHKLCPIFRVGTLLDIVEPDLMEQTQMLRLGGVIRVKIHWDCNLDKSLNFCQPEYSFRRLDGSYKEESFSHGFNFRFASHWKYQNRSYRTLTKAYGLRFIISISGQAGRFDIITLTLNVGSLIGILSLATFICDILVLYVHRQSDVYRQQKFQEVNLNSMRLDSLKPVSSNTPQSESKRKHSNHFEKNISNRNSIDNNEVLANIECTDETELQQGKTKHHDLCDNLSVASKNTNQQTTPIFIYGNFHQQKLGLNSSTTSPSLSSIKQRRSATTSTKSRPSHLVYASNEENQLYDKANISYVDADSTELIGSNEKTDENEHLNNSSSLSHEQSAVHSPTTETFL
ncbi:unnamed protein product [Rotaria sp. Silwood1]|nr:unnamed protein product [Rotaria sp. Silwood1]CAF3334788.1 unnamed protein product [Rotaria sp. Silwood1]CAF3355282.1 unnamed protein product [Rotaria sp. Silwood1]CAF4727682.1 unnamed protein product [Rotaria sp. Silwood1]CAF4783421.1 unnamed protein product [Rotaria sp. Silwood1]